MERWKDGKRMTGCNNHEWSKWLWRKVISGTWNQRRREGNGREDAEKNCGKQAKSWQSHVFQNDAKPSKKTIQEELSNSKEERERTFRFENVIKCLSKAEMKSKVNSRTRLLDWTGRLPPSSKDMSEMILDNNCRLKRKLQSTIRGNYGKNSLHWRR